MQRRTRQGTQFSPFETFASPDDTLPSYQTVRLDFDLADLLTAPDILEPPDDLTNDDLSDWEDVNSRSPSPLSDISSSRSTSPLPDGCDTPPSRSASPATTIADSEDLPPDDMPPLLDSPNQRRAARRALYDKSRRQRKRQQQAASPFTRKAHPKSLPAHRLLPSHKSTFDAANAKSSGGGSWMGPKASANQRR
ncbi:hypothetical protein DFH09DRAFT_1001736 [Mycena vulgaris]|nr:hypothetical protein DFH09DRAFT_1001736 [Mycena vulgaris]